MTNSQLFERVVGLRRKMLRTFALYAQSREELRLYQKCIRLRSQFEADVRGPFILINGGSLRKRANRRLGNAKPKIRRVI